MASASIPKPSRIKVQEHSERLQQQGLRQIQICVPDIRSPTSPFEAHRQLAAVAASAHAADDQALIDTISDWYDE